MKPTFFLVALAAALPSVANAAPIALRLTNSFSAPGYYTDGIDLNPGSRRYTVVLPDAAWGTAPDQGKVVVLSKQLLPFAATASIVSRTGTDFQGFATIDVNNRVTALESDGAAHAYYFNSKDGVKYWDVSSYSYPGTYFMGAAVGNVDSNSTTLETVIADYDGYIEVRSASTTGGLVASFDLGATYGEGITGHVTIENMVDGPTSPYEIVAVGSITGRVFVLQVSGTSMTVRYVSDSMPNGGYADGTGPAVADIDGDGQLEIVVAASGSAQIRAYATNWGSGCKYVWSTPGGADYYWGSPIVGDIVSGNGLNEVVVQSIDSKLSALSVGTANTDVAHACQEGTVLWTHTIGSGGDSWFTPSVTGNLTGGSGREVVAASYTTLEVVDGDLGTAAYNYTDATAQFTENAMIDVTGVAPRWATDIVVSGWSNGKVYRLQTPRNVAAIEEWSGFMGGPRHTGMDH